MVKLTS
ncbi:Pau11p, partial [Saccharomyces cerevisiae YJM1336]